MNRIKREIVLVSDQLNRLDIQDAADLSLVVRGEASLYLHYIDKVDCHIDIIVEKDARLTMLSYNEGFGDVEMQVQVYRDAKVMATFGELSDGDIELKAVFEMLEEGADVEIKTAAMVKHKKHYDLQCIQKAPHTIGTMENYAVVYESGNYQMVDTGKIEKGSYGSESHQKTHVLTMAEKQRSHVTPLLLIDENDVQASHATTLGQPDENQLYYLQTRGLSREQALGLLISGYLMPVAKGLNNEELQSEITRKIEEKAGLGCLM